LLVAGWSIHPFRAALVAGGWTVGVGVFDRLCSLIYTSFSSVEIGGGD
jgi:hypothetical protein